MACRIVSIHAGKDKEAFERGANRFAARHPALDWVIETGQVFGDLHITVAADRMYPITVAPTLDMADSVEAALEAHLRWIPPK